MNPPSSHAGPRPGANWATGGAIKTAGQYWIDALTRLHEMGGLSPGWDGADSEPPSVRTVCYALEFAGILVRSRWLPPTSAIATPDGRICLTWQLPHLHLEFEVSHAGVGFELTDYAADRTDRGVVEGFP
jgi:hypothetical protein